MKNLTLKQLFGEGFYQDAQVIKIQKADLPGLTPLPTNTAESLLCAIVLKAWSNFEGRVTTPEGIPITTPSGKFITFNNSNYYRRLLISLWRIVFYQQRNLPRIEHILLITFFAEPTHPRDEPITPNDLIE